MVSSIHRGALWLQELVENLLCAATVTAGELKINRRRVGLIDILSEIYPVVAPTLAHQAQTLRILPRGVLRDVNADPQRVGQVLVNLISNASKFAPSGTLVEVNVVQRGNCQRISVSDRGPGFPPTQADYLFEPYTQADTHRLSSSGVGLGLAIVKSIINSHGGSVGARNRQGGGACFWFELPSFAQTDGNLCRNEMGAVAVWENVGEESVP